MSLLWNGKTAVSLDGNSKCLASSCCHVDISGGFSSETTTDRDQINKSAKLLSNPKRYILWRAVAFHLEVQLHRYSCTILGKCVDTIILWIFI